MKYWRGSLVLGVGLNILLFNHTALLSLQLFFVILKDAIMQIEKALINDCLHVSKVSWKFLIPTISNFAVIHPMKIRYCFKKVAYFFTVFLLLFLFINKILRLNNLKTETDINAKTWVFVIWFEVIIYLLLHNLHDCNFNLFCVFFTQMKQTCLCDVFLDLFSNLFQPFFKLWLSLLFNI